MIFFHNKKRREKPRYKKLLIARENVLNNKKILNLKKKKWKTFQFHYNKKLKFFKRTKALDQNRYFVTRNAKRGVGYDKRYRDTLSAVRNVKLFYGSSKKRQFKKIIKFIHRVQKKKYKFHLNMLFLKQIESRLDVVLFRAKFCLSIRCARQHIKHGKVRVNNQIVKSKFYILKPGDLISIDPSMFLNFYWVNKKLAREENARPHPPRHLVINYKTFQIVFNDPIYENFTTSLTFNLKLEKVLLNYLKTQ